MIIITPHISISEDELIFSAIRASGPGGQNVNKVSTAVQLRYDALNSPSLSIEVKQRLMNLAGQKLNKEGVIIFTGQKYRTQDSNRKDVTQRLVALIVSAAYRPPPRHATAPTRGSVKRRLNEKKNQSKKKSDRSSTFND